MLINGGQNKSSNYKAVERRKTFRKSTRVLLAQDRIDDYYLQGKRLPDIEYEVLLEIMIKDTDGLREVARKQGFPSLFLMKKLGQVLEDVDEIEGDVASGQLAMIASDFEIFGEDAVRASVKILMKHAAKYPSSLYVLGFTDDEIDGICKMKSVQIDQNLDKFLKSKKLIP